MKAMLLSSIYVMESEYNLNLFLLLTTNKSSDSAYCHWRGRIFSLL